MLSILIPVYNYNSLQLVRNLNDQGLKAKIPYEILVMDDGSTTLYQDNEKINELPNCSYTSLPINIGRAAIRNRLANVAHFNHLLFIDCDASVCSNQFIQNYIPYLNKNQVVCGGCNYDKQLIDRRYSLRWIYGKKREERVASKKNRSSYNSFTTFNFLISKEVFMAIRFNEQIKNYGHEDTLFGHNLRTKNNFYIHIDNPLKHSGLDENKLFLTKTEESIRTLFSLYQSKEYPFLATDSNLLALYQFILKKRLLLPTRILFRLTHRIIYLQLTSSHPLLVLFDFYKLGYLCKISKN
jgi:hypothetical protein